MVRQTRANRYPTPEPLRPQTEELNDPLYQDEHPQVPEVPYDDVAAAAAAEPLAGDGHSPGAGTVAIDAEMGTPSVPA